MTSIKIDPHHRLAGIIVKLCNIYDKKNLDRIENGLDKIIKEEKEKIKY